MNANFFEQHETQETISDWAVATFGSSGSNFNVFKKAKEEFQELEDILTHPPSADYREEAVLEIADVMIVLYRLATRLGYNIHDVIDAKMKINRARKWDLQKNRHID